MIEARRSDIAVIDKTTRGTKIIGVAIPGDVRVRDKELEKKVEKYKPVK